MKGQGMNRIGTFFLIVAGLLSHHSVWAGEGNSLSSWDAFARARALAGDEGHVRLAWYSGHLSKVPECADRLDFFFVFETAADGLPATAIVGLDNVPDAGSCRTKESVTVRPDIPGYGRIYLETLDQVKLDWRDAINAALTAFPDQTWLGTFQVNTPWKYLGHVYYFIELNRSLATVDATTGEVVR